MLASCRQPNHQRSLFPRRNPPLSRVMEVERRSELPGLEDILTWSVRYWDWITARLASP